MHQSATLRKLMAWLATGVLTAAISGPFPFSANAVITGNTQDKDKDKAAKSDKAKSKSKDKDKTGSQSGGNVGNSGGKNDGGKGSFDPPQKSGGGSTQHDNPPKSTPTPK